MMRQVHCHYCGGHRPVSPGGICHGCGSAADQASGIKPRRSRRCPKCTDGYIIMTEVTGISACSGCGHSTHDFQGLHGRRSGRG